MPEPQSVQKEKNHCYTSDLPGKAEKGDGQHSPFRSRLVLYEDGVPLGPAHSTHERIRALGRGLYSHWDRILYFSASDNSDPRTNNRHYSASIALEAPLWVKGFGVGGLMLACFLSWRLMSGISPKKRPVLFFMIVLVSLFIFSELFVRVAFFAIGREYHKVPARYTKYSSQYPYLPYRVRPDMSAGIYSNSKGYRGNPFSWKKAPGVFRVACIGGSTTYEGTYPEHLEAVLNTMLPERNPGIEQVQVLNFGAESWTSVESMINYTVRGSHADLDAIVIYHAFNDMVASGHPENVTPEPDYSHWRCRLKPLPWSSTLWLDTFYVVGLVRSSIHKAQDTWATRMSNWTLHQGKIFQGPGTFSHNLEGMTAFALGRDTTVFLATQVIDCRDTMLIVERGRAMNQAVRRVAEKYEDSGQVFLVDTAMQAEALGLYPHMTDCVHFDEDGYKKLAAFIGRNLAVNLEQALISKEDSKVEIKP